MFDWGLLIRLDWVRQLLQKCKKSLFKFNESK